MTNQNGARQGQTIDYSTGHAPASLADAVALLDALSAAATEENARAALLRARRAISQTGGGRPAIDDRAAIAEVRALVAGGKLTLRSAILKVGRAQSPYNLLAFERRLFRKIKAAAKKV